MQFSPKHLPLLATFAVLPVLLLGCDKPANTTATQPATTTTSAVASSATTVTTATSAVSSAISSTTATLPTSAVTATAILPSLPAAATSSVSTTVTTDTKTATKASKSLITQPTAPNTPEDVLKKATDAMMAGNAKQASSYYHIEGIDMAKMLSQQIPMMQKQLKHLEISPTEYNADKTQAGIFGNLTLANSPQPKQSLYKFAKINGEWKIVE